MAKKVKFYHLWTTKEIVLSITISALVILLIGFLTFHQKLTDYYQMSKYDGVTTGKINDYEIFQGMKQSHLGNEPYITQIKISFTYKVEDEIIENEDLIPGTDRNVRLIKKVVNGTKTDVKVLYQTQQPTNCVIRLEE